MKIATILGVRPQFIKAAVLSPIIRKEHKEILIHTGQHFDDNMSKVFFRELDFPEPDYTLSVIFGTDKEIINSMVRQLKPIVLLEKADVILIYGDTNSTLAGALVADILKIPAIHVEAGERNGLVNNPEEQIRRRVDWLSSLFFCCSEQAMKNLRNEGLDKNAYYIGNLMEISFAKNIKKIWHPHLVNLFGDDRGIDIPQNYYLLTCHRQENSNDKCLAEILLAMEAAKAPVIFPVHPRNKERVKRLFASYKLTNIIAAEPVGYFDSIHLIKNAKVVITDSGGILQEAHFAHTPYMFVLDIPCPPQYTRFDVRRLVRPKREEILQKLKERQEFVFSLNRSKLGFTDFENKVLSSLRDFAASLYNSS